MIIFGIVENRDDNEGMSLYYTTLISNNYQKGLLKESKDKFVKTDAHVIHVWMCFDRTL